jgi:hypothetical protein
MSWSIRAVSDALTISWFSRRIADVSLNIFKGKNMKFVGVMLIFSFFVVMVNYILTNLILLTFMSATIIGLYSIIVWKMFMENEERFVIKNKLYGLTNR